MNITEGSYITRLKHILQVILLLSINIISYTQEQSILNDNIIEYVNEAYDKWNEKSLIEAENILIKKKDKTNSDYFLLAKINYRLYLIEYIKNNYDFNEKIRSYENENPGFLDNVINYGEKALSSNENNMELLYYLANAYLHMINSFETYSRYNPLKNNSLKKMESIDKDNFYYVYYQAFFHSTRDTRTGADRQKGKEYSDILREKFPGSSTFALLGYINYNNYNIQEAYAFYKKALKQNPDNLEAKIQFELINFIMQKPVINEITINSIDDLNIVYIKKHFLHIKPGIVFHPMMIKKITVDLKKYRLISRVKVILEKKEDNKADLVININSAKRRLFNLSAGYDYYFNFNKEDYTDTSRLLKSIFPPTFFFSDDDLYNKGFVSFKFATASFIYWNTKINFNIVEKLDISTGFESFIIPLSHTLEIYSIKNSPVSKLTYLDIKPVFSIGKNFHRQKLKLYLYYEPHLYFLITNAAHTIIQDYDNFILLPDFFAEHILGLKFELDYINLLDFGAVRDGFKLEADFEWIKITPDTIWGYKDYLNVPVQPVFRFGLQVEISKFIKNIFYFSLGFNYKGGINLSQISKIKTGKAPAGIPFGSRLNIHGFDMNRYYADHIFLLNTLFGFKINKHLYLGFYFDICDLIMENTDSYINEIYNSGFYNNLVIGLGNFIKITPGYLFNIIIESGYGFDTGAKRLEGISIGIILQKTFLINYSNNRIKLIH